MNDDLQPLKNRLRWLNRSILVLGVLILLGLIVWAVVGLRKPRPGTESTVIHPASSASNRAARAASAVAAAAPKPAMSTAQQERAAAAAMDALSAASAPKTAAETASQAARVASAAAPTQTASAPTPAPTSVVEAASSAVTAAAPSKPVANPIAKPKSAQHKLAQHKPAVQARTEPARAAAAAAKPKRVGAVGVCRTAGWYVQVGAFGKQQSIDRLASKLHRAGYTQVCVAAQQVRGLHLFYVGPYKNAASARDAKAPLHKLTGVEGILRKLG
ncbi:MAG TPA: SPOR domain-containing protein [Thiomonas arsenitoxydans]|uniref:SPOR domain-containing protein n=1 Tax=Thiomonas TaxID=32012 RepID=UPI0025807E25|nr:MULTISPECIES: SPOR domain-containing protein [Thiomonas]HML82717.1 SPOR domain-containing protein [Thiomonas arsenitoxydans]